MRKLSLAAVGALALAAASPAHGAGGPVIGIDGGAGVTSLDGGSRYFTLHGVTADTIVARLALRQGEVVNEANLRGFWQIPAVADDSTAGGLSGDGRELVVIQPMPPVRGQRTRLAVLDTTRMRVLKRVSLRGSFSFDAISPDGSTIYVVQYVSPRNLARYAVRALDVSSGRLLPRPIVDKRNPGEKMRGYPITRAVSPAGRWAYTLYDGGGNAPFIHALDTVGRRAFCIDLDALAGRSDLFNLRLRVTQGGRRLAVTDGSLPVVVVDTRTLAVSKPRAPAAHVHAPPAPSAGGGRRSWLVTGVLALALLLATAVTLRARLRRLPRRARAR